MSVVFVMVPVALVLGALFVAAFVWASRDGQFDDTDTPAVRMLLDETTNSSVEPSCRSHRGDTHPKSDRSPRHTREHS